MEGDPGDIFDAQQSLVITYSRAVASGQVFDKLFSEVIDKYGEKGAVEFTTVVAFWSFWAIFPMPQGARQVSHPSRIEPHSPGWPAFHPRIPAPG